MAPSQSPQPTLCKSIIQARLKPSLETQHAILTKLRSIEEKYSELQVEAGIPSLLNYDRRCSILLRPDIIQYEQDSSSPESEEKGIGEVKAILKELPSKTIERIALKRTYLFALDGAMDFESLVALLNVKLLVQETVLRKAMPGVSKDVMYRIDMQDSGCQYNVTAGPVKRDEIMRFSQINANRHLKAEHRIQEFAELLMEYPALSLLIDVDCFRAESLANTEATFDKFIATAKERTEETSRGLAAFVLG